MFNTFGDPTPGPRHFHGFHTSGFPWQGTVDSRVEVASSDSYRMSMRLSREGLIAGPSSGQALHGLLEYIAELKQAGRLAELRDETTGEISCVFPCSDLPYQYLPAYFQKLGTDEFPAIENEVSTTYVACRESFSEGSLLMLTLSQILLHCDQSKHDERWILDPQRAATILFGAADLKPGQRITVQSFESSASSQDGHSAMPSILCSWLPRLHGLFFQDFGFKASRCCRSHAPEQCVSSALVLDIRGEPAFRARHVPGSYSAPIRGLTPQLAGGDLFGDANAVHLIWTQIQTTFAQRRVSKLLRGARENHQAVVLVCYNGDAAKLGCSTLRSQNIEAFSVEGGFDEMWSVLEGLDIV